MRRVRPRGCPPDGQSMKPQKISLSRERIDAILKATDYDHMDPQGVAQDCVRGDLHVILSLGP